MSQTLARKRQSSFVFEAFGFPVELRNVPMIRIRGEWTPDVDYNKLEEALLMALVDKPARLTGNEVHFIRLSSLSMTLQEFAERFDVTHPTVIAWERAGNAATSMKWPAEKDIRLEVLRRLKPRQTSRFADEYSALEKSRPGRPQSSPSLTVGKILRLGAVLNSTVWRPRTSEKGMAGGG